MIARFFQISVAAACLFATSADAGGPYGSIRVGFWKGGAYTDATGQFAYCGADAHYRSGVMFTVAMGASGNWGLSFVDPKWQLPADEVSSIDLTFDGKAQFRVFGKAIGRDQL